MSELNNPLFENQREFLERQKEEYKNALMGDVDQIKTQGQEIGKKVAMAGGVVLAGYLLKRLFSSSDKKKPKKVKASSKANPKKAKKSTHKHPVAPPITASTHEYASTVHKKEDDSVPSSISSVSSEQTSHGDHSQSSTALTKGFLKSDLAQMISQQVVALLMLYITKKVDEYVTSVSENNDIAAAPVEVDVIEIETTEYIVPEENAL